MPRAAPSLTRYGLPALSLAALALALLPAQAADQPAVKPLSTEGTELERVVAVVNDGVVLESELDAQTLEISGRLRDQKIALPDPQVMRSQVLERLVLDEIQAQHAEHAGIKVSDEQVNGALADIAKRRNVTLEQLPENLAAAGLDYNQYRADLKREIARQVLRQRDVVEHISITPHELDQYLEHQQKTATFANEYNVSHILIAVPQEATPAQVAQAAARARDIVTRARRRGFQQARADLLPERDHPRRWPARLAQGHRTADLPG